MCSKYFVLGLISASLFTESCSSHYELLSVKRNRIIIDERYDANPDEAAIRFLAPYQHTVDSLMSPIVGQVAYDLSAKRPESSLSNLLADILVWGSSKFQEHPDFSVYNVGGIRAAFAKGTVTYGDVLDVSPFENKICLLSLSGEKVLELFRQVASRGGEGVSHGVQLKITKSGKLVEAILNGKPIDPQATYRVATLDYLAQGNDQLVAFKSGVNVLSPKSKDNNARFIIMDYFREKCSGGRALAPIVEGRIKVVE